MNYTITPASVERELQLTFTPKATLAEIQRGAGLAGYFEARATRSPVGWTFTPAKMRKWKVLFDSGFEVVQRKTYAPRFRRADTRPMAMYEAMTVAQLPEAAEVI